MSIDIRTDLSVHGKKEDIDRFLASRSAPNSLESLSGRGVLWLISVGRQDFDGESPRSSESILIYTIQSNWTGVSSHLQALSEKFPCMLFVLDVCSLDGNFSSRCILWGGQTMIETWSPMPASQFAEMRNTSEMEAAPSRLKRSKPSSAAALPGSRPPSGLSPG
jgi:hypothetical protein